MAQQSSGNTKRVSVIVVSPVHVICDALRGALGREKRIRILNEQGSLTKVAVFHVIDSVAIAGGRTALANTAANPAYLGDSLYTGSGVIDVIVGEGVRRIGAYSGQSDALVTHGCVDRRSGITTLYTLCMQRAANSVVDGDSGGLMWVPLGWGSGPTPRPAGVIAQRDPVTTGVYYSKLGLTLGALGYQYFVSW